MVVFCCCCCCCLFLFFCRNFCRWNQDADRRILFRLSEEKLKYNKYFFRTRSLQENLLRHEMCRNCFKFTGIKCKFLDQLMAAQNEEQKRLFKVSFRALYTVHVCRLTLEHNMCNTHYALYSLHVQLLWAHRQISWPRNEHYHNAGGRLLVGWLVGWLVVGFLFLFCFCFLFGGLFVFLMKQAHLSCLFSLDQWGGKRITWPV